MYISFLSLFIQVNCRRTSSHLETWPGHLCIYFLSVETCSFNNELKNYFIIYFLKTLTQVSNVCVSGVWDHPGNKRRTEGFQHIGWNLLQKARKSRLHVNTGLISKHSNRRHDIKCAHVSYLALLPEYC